MTTDNGWSKSAARSELLARLTAGSGNCSASAWLKNDIWYGQHSNCFSYMSGRDGVDDYYVGLYKYREGDSSLQAEVVNLYGSRAVAYAAWLEWVLIDSPLSDVYLLTGDEAYGGAVHLDVNRDVWEVHQSSIMLRMHKEHQRTVEVWMILAHYGMDKALAFLIACMCSFSGGGLSTNNDMLGHAAISDKRTSMVKGFTTGVRRLDGQPYNKKCCYGGHGSMWSGTKAPQPSMERDSAIKTHYYSKINHLFKRVESKDAFGRRKVSHGVQSDKESMAEFIKGVESIFLSEVSDE